jgi:hypothetical protein
LFNLEEFLTAQQCTWVLRANKSLRDNWRCDLYGLSSGNCLSVSGKIINQNVNPILHCLGTAFERLHICHDSANENFLKAFVLHNPLIFRGRGDKNILTAEYLECADNLQLLKKLANLTFEQCFGHEGLLTTL